MKEEKRVFALGFFDGVHLGHQALVAACVTLADSLEARTAAITFDRHPRALFTDAPPPLISTAASVALTMVFTVVAEFFSPNK